VNPLISGLFRQFRDAEELRDLPEDDTFELFATSLILPDELLEQAEKTDFLLDHGTVGIDVVGLEINGQLARDASDAADICEASTRLEVGLHFIQAKRSHSTKTARLLSRTS
jgi:hypothetical protein